MAKIKLYHKGKEDLIMDEEEVERKQEKAARIVYIVLAVVITATMAISIVSAVNRRNRGKNPVPDTAPVTDAVTDEVTQKEKADIPHRPLPEITEADIPKPKDEVTDAMAESPDESEKTEPTVIERVYVIPVNGYVIKDFTIDMPVYSVTMNDYRAHNGTDIAASVGDPVYAFSDGEISKIYYDPMMGQTIEIDHGDGLRSVYQNLQVTLPDDIEVGVKVQAGDIIGAVGETSLIECAEVSHLHFSVLKDGAYEAPSDYIGSINIIEE